MPLTAILSASALAHWLLSAVALWVLVGLLGSLISALRGERSRSHRGLLTILLVTVAYMGTLLAVSLRQPARVLAPGQSRCFQTVCFSTIAAQELPGFQARNQVRARLVRVTISIHNTDRTQTAGEPSLRPSLVDSRGRRWSFIPGLAGVSLSTRLPPGGITTSDPVFRVPQDAVGLRLELLHEGWYSGRFVIADPESLLHRSTEMHLPANHQTALSEPNPERNSMQ